MTSDERQTRSDALFKAIADASTGMPTEDVVQVLLVLAASTRTQLTRAVLMGWFNAALSQVEQNLPPIPQAPEPQTSGVIVVPKDHMAVVHGAGGGGGSGKPPPGQ